MNHFSYLLSLAAFINMRRASLSKSARILRFSWCVQVAVQAAAYIAAADLPPLHALAKRRARALTTPLAQRPAHKSSLSHLALALFKPPASLAGSTGTPAATGGPASHSDSESDTDTWEQAESVSALAKLLPFHVTISASLQRCTCRLLDEAHPGAADPAASPAALAYRRKHASDAAATTAASVAPAPSAARDVPAATGTAAQRWQRTQYAAARPVPHHVGHNDLPAAGAVEVEDSELDDDFHSVASRSLQSTVVRD